MNRGHVDPLTIVGVGFLIFFVFNVLSDRGWFTGVTEFFTQPLVVTAAAPDTTQDTAAMGGAIQVDMQSAQVAKAPLPLDDPHTLAWPYAHYVITQGPHGMSYGHLAIDLSAGKGATILSPINGEVTDLYVDQYGNTTLIIENSHYKILMYHGVYTVQVGERLTIGQPVGTESNIGYTLDAQGRLCTGRDCGYHTHLNIFDKNLQMNVNPLEVLPR